MSYSVLTVVGKDRIGIVRDVAALLAEHQISIVNISQQLMEGYFTMVLLLNLQRCVKTPEDMAVLMAGEGRRMELDIRLQNEDVFNAMHRI